MEKNLKKSKLYVYISLYMNHFAVYWKHNMANQLYFNTIFKKSSC